MRMYHYCCERDMKGIRKGGITEGAVVTWEGKGRGFPVIRKGWQWLTFSADHGGQSWATRETIRYDRTEYRWTVEIPDEDLSQLYDRDRLAAEIPGSEALFDGWAGSENWRVFHGPIFRKQLIRLERWNALREEWEDMIF